MRSTLLDAARRAYLGLTRGTMKKANDKELMQEVDVHLFGPAGTEGKVKIERFQQYGFTGVPHKKKDEKDDHVAEVLVGFLGGNRGHAVVLMIDDRRHRLKNMEDGEVALYDDQGQVVRLSRGKLMITSHKAIQQEVSKPTKERGEKDYGQDANAERQMKTRITQGEDHIQIQVGEKTFMRLDEKGIKLQSDKDIVSQADGTISAVGDTTGWKGPKED